MRFYAACEAALTRIAAPDVRICHAITRRMVCGTGDEILCNPVVVGVTMTLVRRSGTDVPAARMVRPITAGGMPVQKPNLCSSEGESGSAPRKEGGGRGDAPRPTPP